ncbi:MAG: lytic transglycosylase domain-containing protein [Deltaproteobacteria bacterium]|nr:lytic transglycosylase domain-containing protein [Deltaproteobacteria bacterium]
MPQSRPPLSRGQVKQLIHLCLKSLIKRYDGDLRKALIAYNWGPGRLNRYGAGQAPRQTRVFINRVLGLNNRLAKG